MTKSLLVQDNTVTSARYDMSAMEKNIMYMVMSQLHDDDEPTKYYKISTPDLMAFTENRVRYDEFQEAIRRLLTRDFIIKKSDGRNLQITFISSADWDIDGSIDIGIDPKMRPYLFQLKQNFTTFELDTVMSLKSKFSKRLYEMLCQFKSTGILRISVLELKERLQLISDNGAEQYERWSSFEKNVLKTACDEISTKSEFEVKYTLKKVLRKVALVEFVFSKRQILKIEANLSSDKKTPQPNRKNEALSKPEKEIAAFIADHSDKVKAARMIERLREYNMTNIQIASILKKHDESVVNKTLYDVNVNRESIKNVAGYLCSAFGL